MGVVHQLRRLSVAMERDRGMFARAHRLHPTDVAALTHLLDAERSGAASSPTALAQALGLGTAATTAVIDRLEAADLVRRVRPAEGDRRRVGLVVTDAAQELGRGWFGPMIAGLLTAVDALPPRELAAVTRFLDATLRAVEDRGGQREPRT